MAGPKVVVFDNARIRRQLATLPQVHAKVAAVTEAVATRAQAAFARHDHPGGHHIEHEVGKVDGTVSLVGPAAISLEFGHFTNFGGPDLEFGNDRIFVRGIYVLGQAIGQSGRRS